MVYNYQDPLSLIDGQFTFDPASSKSPLLNIPSDNNGGVYKTQPRFNTTLGHFKIARCGIKKVLI